MAKIDKKYHKLLNKILDKGRWYEDPNRKGVKRLQIPHYSFKYNLKNGFPAITTKKLYWKGVVGELLWFLRGDTNIKYLVDNNINIWNKDAHNFFKKDLTKKQNLTDKEFIDLCKHRWSKNWTNIGDLGRVYGAQWRDWNKVGLDNDGEQVLLGRFDQISNLIKNLKKKPLSTDHIVTAWNPGELNNMALPPCHKGFQIMVYELTLEERLDISGPIDYEDEEEFDTILNSKSPKYGFDLVWEQRSVDTFLGLPFNIASYALLAYIIGKMVNMVPGKIYGDLRNVHIYDNAIDTTKEQLSRNINKYDKCKLNHLKTEDFYKSLSKNLSLLGHLDISDFKLNNYKSYDNIKTEMLSRDE